MTTEEKIGGGKRITAQEIAKHARLALRTSTVNVGIFALPPVIVGRLVDNLVPKSILDPGPMILEFDTTKIVGPDDGDQYTLYQRKGGTGPIEFIEEDVALGPVSGRPALLNIEVPTTALVDDDLTKGSTNYQYFFIFYRGIDGNPEYFSPIQAEIDRTAPEQDKLSQAKLKPSAAVFTNLSNHGTGIIDEAWLTNNDALDLTIDRNYEFYRPDDEVDIYIADNYGSGTPVYFGALISDKISIPRDQLPKPDGLFYCWFVLRDIVGNQSELALTNTFNVVRLPPPGLIDCEIPKGITPDVIDLEDLETPVYVNVPYTRNGQETDRILPTFGVPGGLTFGLASQLLGAAPRVLQFVVSTSRLVALWGNATAEVPVVARYNFSRGLDPLIPSANTISALDFSYRGPPNPIFPSRENPDMSRVTVRGESGIPDHITADDRGKDATISTPMVSAGNPWKPVGDETARLWYDGKEVFNVLLTAGTVTPLTATITAADIDAAGPGRKIAYWTVEETGGRNVMKSYNTPVDVDAVRVVLDPPTVRLFNGFVSCRYLTIGDFALPVSVPIHSTHMPTGTQVRIMSEGTEDSAGLILIPGTEFSDTYTITGSETGGIFVKNIQPYSTKIKPIQPPRSSGLPNGYIKIWYNVTIGGVPTDSQQFLNEVSLLNDSGNYCEGTPTV